MPLTPIRRLTAAILIMIVCIIGVGLAYNGGPFALDQPVMTWIAGHRNDALIPLVADLSEVFGPLLVTLWTGVVAAIFVIHDRTIGRGAAVIGSVATAAAITEIVKLAVARPRPPARFHPSTLESTFSYPSGHVTGTCALAIATALVATVTSTRPTRRWAIVAAIATVALASATRMYLGVHWFSDVVAACAVGTAAALAVPGLLAVALDEVSRSRPDRLPAWCSARPLQTQNRTHSHVHR